MDLEILVIGSEEQFDEVVDKLGSQPNFMCFSAENAAGAQKDFGKDRIVFDFTTRTGSFDRTAYAGCSGMAIFLDTTLTSLSSFEIGHESNSFFGFCGLPTFVNRSTMEVCVPDEKSLANLKLVFEKLGSEYVVVADKVGFVTPRVICMIINEAYYTVEEGTATREDIDMAMKLGTNYPWGPFEWGRRIGLDNVRALLNAVHKESGDDRYRICPLLEKER